MSADSGNLSSPSWTFLLHRHTQTLGTECSDDILEVDTRKCSVSRSKKQCIMVYKKMVLRARDIAWLDSVLLQFSIPSWDRVQCNQQNLFTTNPVRSSAWGVNFPYLNWAASVVTNCNSILDVLCRLFAEMYLGILSFNPWVSSESVI